MANELSTASATDVTLTDLLAPLVQNLYADRTPLARNPVFTYLGDFANANALSVNLALVGLNGYDALTSSIELEDPGNTAFTTSSHNIEFAQKRLIRSVSDYVAAAGAVGISNLFDDPEVMAREAVMASEQCLASMFCDLGATFTQTASAAEGLDIDTFLDAKGKLLDARADGEYVAVLHPDHFQAFERSLALNSGGAVQWNTGVQALLSNPSATYKGNIFGVHIYVTNKVAEIEGDYASFMVASGAIAWASMTPKVTNERQAVVDHIRIERDRNARTGEDLLIIDTFLGAAVVQPLGGVKILCNQDGYAQ